MKIVVVGPYPPPYGGVSISIKQCSEIWTSRGHEVHVINFTNCKGTRMVNKVFVHDVAKKDITGRNVFSAISSLISRNFKHAYPLLAHDYSLRERVGCLLMIREVEDICKKYGIAILHSHHLSGLRSTIAYACSRDLDKPFVVSGYGESWQFCNNEKMLSRMKRLAYFATHLTATSEHCKNGIARFLEVPPEKVSVIYAGVDTKRYNPEVNGVWLKKKYGIGEERVVLFVGHLHPRKGPQYAIRAMSLVFRKMKDVKLLVVGPDYWGHRTEFENLASQLGVSDKVIFTGEVDEKDLPAHYSVGDVLLFPSTTLVECMGMTLKQAMAAGIPVIGAEIGGVPEAVVDGETGYLVKPNDEVELAENIVKLLKDEKLRKKMGLKGRERALELFGKEVMAKRLLNLYTNASSK